MDPTQLKRATWANGLHIVSSSPSHQSFPRLINHLDTWDVVGNATFSQPIGYLEKGYDFDKTLSVANVAMD